MGELMDEAVAVAMILCLVGAVTAIVIHRPGLVLANVAVATAAGAMPWVMETVKRWEIPPVAVGLFTVALGAAAVVSVVDLVATALRRSPDDRMNGVS